MYQEIVGELKKRSNKKKAQQLSGFFKTGKGEYGEGDVFMGVTVPEQRKVVRKFQKEITLADIQQLLHSPIHEHRLTALLLLVGLYKGSKKSPDEQKKIVAFYVDNASKVNNWDLVDSSAHYILGDYLIDKSKNERKILYVFAKSESIWKQRIGIMSTFAFIKNEDYDDALAISKLLLNHEHDLIHKAVGWMLREIGNRNQKIEEEFLVQYYKKMPRTMLRYAIEKFDEAKRQKYLKGEI